MTTATEPLPTASITRTSSLVTQVRTDIIGGVFAPGSKLLIKDLCARYGTSPIPMREALSRLTSSGFVQAEDQRGFKVADASAHDLLDISRARVLVEIEALRLSVLQGDVAWESRVVAAHHQLSRLAMREAAAPGSLSAQWDEAHMAFHDALLSACGSRVLLELAANLRERFTRYRYISAIATGGSSKKGSAAAAKRRDITAEHVALLDAVLARDVDRATALLQGHFEQTTELALEAAGLNLPQKTRGVAMPEKQLKTSGL
ncbi:GntR family transcriptional regulator [Acidovorax sp. A1169]|uniref:GntR family transcriptional regulator n=1 Tax=Acidovorax sp. A1169 TaxID=3059524 RepID=UPI002737EC3E|nr:FCD domain-containing protein [Acidovorax sp. A1169]MDP4078543.1 FCD domain-containing protein [Acidovorax sp. A1169]